MSAPVSPVDAALPDLKLRSDPPTDPGWLGGVFDPVGSPGPMFRGVGSLMVGEVAPGRCVS